MASKALSLTLYNLLLPFGLVFMLPGAIIKMRRRNGRWRDLAQRVGCFDETTQKAINALPQRERLWVHAVSVGEVNVAKKLITRLLKTQPDLGIVLSTTTPTGHALAAELAAQHAGRLVAIFSPVDLPGVGRLMLERIQPTQLVLVEAEVWPNLTNSAGRLGIPVSLVNARLSPRSERRYRKFQWLTGPIFRMLKQVLVQEEDDIARWEGLGVARERIHLTGSIKYDPEGASVAPAKIEELRNVLTQTGISTSQPILLAASTHAGEEIEFARVFQRLREQIRDLALLIVPRHVERRAEITAALKTIGLSTALRSIPASRVDPNASVFIIDTTGELAAWQHLATLVVVGKSFLAEGGQNPAEAALAEKPVLFGPHMENFTPLVELLLKKKGAQQVGNFDELGTACLALLQDSAKAIQMGQAGQRALQAHQGATQRSVERLIHGVGIS
ncbi:MAG: 3-deoxy-D-manno-octulosonic acid transferase [Prosthecobacter sp.]|jgi:3-deoxy-D-manno-octulosonic-acid transferase|uniref:3-deoxy-D-manno-octulosonic acid transferase n=1 Tax=Prosthecobacter sp. TaxID=1965333 RepID=UPI001A07E555|nr:3-deoxy-D-manno-octulosonic acid transferase [Prosthecobacter sp.]MBE2286899.1 3-deoxy-D-manno-octulosonic acid transferase [Prosthecobacter sp.]